MPSSATSDLSPVAITTPKRRLGKEKSSLLLRKVEKQGEGAEDCNCSPGVHAGQLELRAGGVHLLAGGGEDRALLGCLVDAAWAALKGKINCSSLIFEKYCSVLRPHWGKYVGESVPCDLVLLGRLWCLRSWCGGGTGPPTCYAHVMGAFLHSQRHAEQKAF